MGGQENKLRVGYDYFLSLRLYSKNNPHPSHSAKVIQWVPRRHKVLTHGQEHLFRKVTSVSIHSFVEWLDTFSYVLRPADMTVKEVNQIRCFVIDIAKYLILLSCRLAMEHLCVLQLDDFGRSQIYIIDHNPSWKENQRQKRESFWICELQTLHPEGINKKA